MAGILRVDQANVDYIYAKTAGATPYIPGHIINVVYARSKAQATTTSTTPVAIDSTLNLVITPKSVNSKIFVVYNIQCCGSSAAYNNFAYIYRNSTTQLTYTNCYRVDYQNNVETTRTTLVYLDSPASTSTQTYSVYVAQGNGGYNIQYNYATSDNAGGDWGYSYAYAMEVAQ
jgi:hypothetical protein